MSVRFYNPGTKIDDMLRFDHPTNDPRHQNNISYYKLQADPQSFFDVPTEIVIQAESGEIVVPVRFADRIRIDYRDYGCVMVNGRRKAEDIPEDDNIATNDKDAKQKGERLWGDYLMAKAREHIENVDRARAAGGVPLRAKGVYAHALKVLGMADPADAVGTAIERTQESAVVAELRQEIAKLTELVKKRG